MSGTVDKALSRYNDPAIANHLASHYVLGQLSPLVRQRVNTLRREYDHQLLEDRILFWEQKFSPLNDAIPELAPFPETFSAIQARLNMTDNAQSKEKSTSWFSWDNVSLWRFSGVFSLIFCAILGFNLLQQDANLGELSYIAVLEDTDKTPLVVASTYGDTKKLVLDILTLPEIDTEESFELWVTSKTDNQTRSLGEIPRGKSVFDRELSEAEWRLIADSSFLIISVEDEGGSPIGEPSDSVVSRGICIRLAGRDDTGSV